MIAEIGVFCLILALLFSGLLVIVPTVALVRNTPSALQSALWYVRAQTAFILLAYISLALCFLSDDFSVVYVLSNSAVSLPWFYKLCAVWGGHEGSMLLWVTILSLWTFAVSCLSSQLDTAIRIRVLVVLGALSVGFLLFLLMTSNPFLRQFSLLETTGRDLNPLLQDPGFLFHPPMLYMGYVGFSVAFAFAIAALWSGELKPQWARWTRPWTLAAWCCLTLGITLGSLWAYRELGWGGWWFWDPVENASFMPWLAGTALLHSLAVSEKRAQFMVWTLLLGIITFSLSLVGTFLVRSGVLTSVHAFAVDPERGLFILCFLSFVIGGAFLCFALRAKALTSEQHHHLVSRETALLLNNVLLVAIMLTVLTGTIYPLIIDGLGLGKLSVGAPYFNTVFIPLSVPLLLLMGIGIHLRWQKDSLKRILKPLSILLIISLVALLLITKQMITTLGLSLALWIMVSTIWLCIIRIKQQGWRRLSLAFWGMVVAHVGVAVTVIGIAVSSGFGMQAEVRMQPGESIELAGYQFYFKQEKPLKGPNYTGTEATFSVSYKTREKLIYPQKRVYAVGKMALTESAIDVNPWRDLYVALGEPLSDTAWSLRIYYKPLVRWIWFGGFFMCLGGVFALADKRYRKKVS